MATLKSIAFVIIAASTTCQAIEGPTVSLVTPRHGEQYRQRVQINLHVEIGEGPEAEAIAAKPSSYQICSVGGLAQPICVPLLGGEKLPIIDVAPPESGMSMVKSWIQLNYTNANAAADPILSSTVGPAFAVGRGDVVFTWEAPARAVQALRQRVASLHARETYVNSNPPSSRATAEIAAAVYERAQTMYHLGLALMRNGPTNKCDTYSCPSDILVLTDPLAEAAAAFASAAALGLPAAVGAHEEVLWIRAAHHASLHRRVGEMLGSSSNTNLSSSTHSEIQVHHETEPLPLFPCTFQGRLKRVIPTAARAKEGGHQGSTLLKERFANESEWFDLSANFIPYTYPSSSWGNARAMLTEAIASSCREVFGSADASKRESKTVADSVANVVQNEEDNVLGGACVTSGLSAARREVARVCGDVGELASVVAVRTQEPTDINEHLLTLEALAFEAGSVLECGVRGVLSSWAFLHGLARRRDIDHNKAAIDSTGSSCGRDSVGSFTCADPFIVQNDLEDCYSPQFAAAAARADIPVRFHWKDDLTLDMPYDLGPQYVQGKLQSTMHQSVGLIFIDTLHVYGQLKRELALLAPFADIYLVMHDTTTDAIDGEAVKILDRNITVRMGWSRSAHEVAVGRGWPEQDLLQGLWPAVTEFLADHQGEWQLHARYENNNGLTVLKRIGRPSHL